MLIIQLSPDKARHHKIGDRLHLLLNGGAVAIALVALATPAIAYRPFDGTDAAVADVKEVEIELPARSAG